jgi:hypothetical protein
MYTISKHILCYTAYITGFHIHLLQVQTYCCKANPTTDITMHKIRNYLPLSFIKHVQLKTFQTKVIQRTKSYCTSQVMWKSNIIILALGSLVVSVLATGTNVRGFKPGQGRCISNADKMCSMTFFRWEVKPSISCRKILWHVKEPYRHENRYFISKIQGHFSPSFSCFATRCICWLLPESSGIWIKDDQNIRNGFIAWDA